MEKKFKIKGNLKFKRMFEMIDKVNKRTGKNKIYIFFDMIYCYFKYQAGYVDYYVFNFAKLPNKERKTFITRGVNEQYFAYLNSPEYFNYFDDKILFNKTFKDFIKRDYLDIRNNKDEFIKFIEKHSTIMCKPINMMCGKGIEKRVIDKDTDIDKLYDELMSNNQFLIEEVVIQHKDMAKLNPSSVNTLRIVTCNVNNKTTIMFRAIRIGSGNNVVDNFNSGGMMSTISEDGIISSPAMNKNGDLYKNHPNTNTKIEGYAIPYFKEAIEFAKKASKVIPEVGLVGWDIAITDNGPVMIEGNNKPGHDIYQSEINKKGMKPFFDSVIYGSTK
ncbi:MAG: hypothetical protein IJZ36_02555 [Bacilli bacterium]|nr:hypothetical protein [Bacilli bacterium]